uniref:Serine/threonine-protein phosphatase 7 long form homolog n=1 Tax=Nicotiana tabacum TaxID=4097 RepID=A0A1S3X7L6_TOBAC|nr:protein MAIN-LIKE 2-like [Nicotiana tomentosiformis]XP_016435876.1 PREDICTED: serine/threonine-protein phosphatase 7 long form homolog [Nicotiana tabacum]
MFGLLVDGLAVHSPPVIREFRRPEYLQLLERLTEFRPAEETAISGISRLQLLPVRQHLEALHEHITNQTPDKGIEQQSRLLLLMIFGGILFPNTSGNLVNLHFLAHLEQLDDLPLYSWGGAVLAYLYRQLCRVSMGSVRDVAGFLPLQQVWA